jgi:hypothetical protein
MKKTRIGFVSLVLAGRKVKICLVSTVARKWHSKTAKIVAFVHATSTRMYIRSQIARGDR